MSRHCLDLPSLRTHVAITDCSLVGMNVKRWLLVGVGEWQAGGSCVAVRER